MFPYVTIPWNSIFPTQSFFSNYNAKKIATKRLLIYVLVVSQSPDIYFPVHQILLEFSIHPIFLFHAQVFHFMFHSILVKSDIVSAQSYFLFQCLASSSGVPFARERHFCGQHSHPLIVILFSRQNSHNMIKRERKTRVLTSICWSCKRPKVQTEVYCWARMIWLGSVRRLTMWWRWECSNGIVSSIDLYILPIVMIRYTLILARSIFIALQGCMTYTVCPDIPWQQNCVGKHDLQGSNLLIHTPAEIVSRNIIPRERIPQCNPKG